MFLLGGICVLLSFIGLVPLLVAIVGLVLAMRRRNQLKRVQAAS